MIEEFKKYVTTKYDINSPKVKHKYFHSIRVMYLCNLLSKNEGFTDEEVKIATIIGLLHDIGRFKQVTLYDTYEDNISFDHAEAGVEILMSDNFIEKFCDNKNYYDVIIDSIRSHNKYEIDPNTEEENIKFCKIIRDADKLDILESVISNSILKSCEENLSEDCINNFYEEKLISNIFSITDSDKILNLVSFIFDLNYKSSINYIKEKNVINRIFTHLGNPEKLKKYFIYLNNYIEN